MGFFQDIFFNKTVGKWIVLCFSLTLYDLISIQNLKIIDYLSFKLMFMRYNAKTGQYMQCFNKYVIIKLKIKIVVLFYRIILRIKQFHYNILNSIKIKVLMY